MASQFAMSHAMNMFFEKMKRYSVERLWKNKLHRRQSSRRYMFHVNNLLPDDIFMECKFFQVDFNNVDRTKNVAHNSHFICT